MSTKIWHGMLTLHPISVDERRITLTMKSTLAQVSPGQLSGQNIPRNVIQRLTPYCS